MTKIELDTDKSIPNATRFCWRDHLPVHPAAAQIAEAA